MNIFSLPLGFLLCVGAIPVFVWAFADPHFRSTEGFIRGTICLPFAIGLALFILGYGVLSRLWKPAAWFGLALVGQAAALQMIDAGPLVHYQHYKPFSLLITGENPFFLVFILLQTVVVMLGLINRWPTIKTWVSSTYRIWQILGIGLIFILAAAAVQRNIQLYVGDLIIAAFVQAVNLGNILFFVWALPEDTNLKLKQKIEKVFENAEEDENPKIFKIDNFAVLATVWVIALAALLGWLSYNWHPHVADEVAYLYQARFLANRAITLPAPPVPQAFDLYLMEFKGNVWFPVTPPGWPAILALGARLGIPGLINPLLSGLGVLLAYLLLEELYNRRIARTAIFLLCVSPWYVFMGMNYMTHTATLTFALAAAVAVIQARKSGKPGWGLLAGLAVGMGGLIRPLDGVIVGVLIGLWVVGIGGKRLNVLSIVLFTVGTLIIGAVILSYNHQLTGSWTTFPINAYLDSHFGPGKNDLGFGPNRGYGWPIQPFPGHSPLGAMINANLNTFSINIDLFGWSVGSLLIVTLLLFSGSLGKSDYLMIAVCLANFIPYFFYYFSGGPDFGARYWFLMLIPCLAFTARGIQFLQGKLDSGRVSSFIPGNRVMIAVLSLSILALVNYFPWRAIDKYHNYLNMRPDLISLDRKYNFGKSLVLIRGKESQPDYASAAIYNPLDWQADAPVYAWDRNSEIQDQLLKAFADRQVWIVDGPSITQGGYEVVAGPLAPGELIARESTAGSDGP